MSHLRGQLLPPWRVSPPLLDMSINTVSSYKLLAFRVLTISPMASSMAVTMPGRACNRELE